MNKNIIDDNREVDYILKKFDMGMILTENEIEALCEHGTTIDEILVPHSFTTTKIISEIEYKGRRFEVWWLHQDQTLQKWYDWQPREIV